MLATPLERGAALPVGPEWVFEVKWDGVRLLADTTRGELRLFTRTERDVTTTYPDLGGLATIQGAVLDGEVIAMAGGRPSFEALGARMHVSDPARARDLASSVPVTYMVFDVLALYGVDLTRHPFAERRGTLERLHLPEHCLLSPVYDDGAALWSATSRQGLEGVVAKRRSGPYSPGRRTPDWVKSAHRLSRTALVGGWRVESTGSGRLGALLLGAPEGEGRLRYLGRAGSGLTGSLAAHLREVLAPLARPDPPFADPLPAADARGATWCEPEVLAQVTYLARTPSGRLRHPVLRGVRDDAAPDPWEVA